MLQYAPARAAALLHLGTAARLIAGPADIPLAGNLGVACYGTDCDLLYRCEKLDTVK